MSGRIEITNGKKIEDALSGLASNHAKVYEILARGLALPEPPLMTMAPSHRQHGLIEISLCCEGDGNGNTAFQSSANDFQAKLTLNPRAGNVNMDWIFSIPALRGNQIGACFTRNVIDLATVCGFNTINLQACSQIEGQPLIGSYLFAHYFLPEKGDWHAMRHCLKYILSDHGNSKSCNQARQILSRRDPFAIWDLAELEGPLSDINPTPIGKYLLSNGFRTSLESWRGYFDLSCDVQRDKFKSATGLNFHYPWQGEFNHLPNLAPLGTTRHSITSKSTFVA